MPSQYTDLAHRFYAEVVDTGDLAHVEDFCDAGFVNHEEGPPGFPDGIEGVKAFVRMFHEGFPDLNTSIQETVEEGDRLAMEVRFTGTHKGEFMGVPASGKHIDVEAVEIVRFAGDKAVERWGVTDNMTLMQQIGAVPEEAPA